MDTGEARAKFVDVVVVGGGPVGIETAVGLSKAGLSCVVLEKGAIGNTMTWWAPGTRWFSSNERISIAGVPLMTPDQSKATREQYLAYLLSVVKQFELEVRTFEPVVAIVPVTNIAPTNIPATTNSNKAVRWSVQTLSRGQKLEYRCNAVVLAVGGTDFPNTLGVEGEELPLVDGYLREPHTYYGQKVLVVGGRNSAVEAALRLYHAGAQVTLCYRGASLPEDHIKYWLMPEMRSLLRSGRISSLFGTVVKKITPREVFFERVDEALELEIPVSAEFDRVLKLIGYQQDKTLLRAAGVNLVETGERPEFDPATMQTNVPGVFVAGTAIAGTQSSRYQVFLENCHEHVEKILATLKGHQVAHRTLPYETQMVANPES